MNWFTRTRPGIVLLGVVQGRVLEVDAVTVLIALRFHHCEDVGCNVTWNPS
jgi:hypothetical protein